MSNKAYSEGPSDTKPKESAKGGMKNDDGRIDGAAWSTDHTPGSIQPVKEVVDPNASVPSLGSQSGAEGAH